MNELKLTNHMMTTTFQTMKPVIHVAKNAADSVLCSTTNDECQLLNWKCVLRKCTARTSIAIPGFERYLSNRAPMIIFNTCMTPSTCSHHDILIRENNTTYLYAKETSKNTCFLFEQIIQAKTPDLLRGILYERVKLFSVQRNIVDFT